MRVDKDIPLPKYQIIKRHDNFLAMTLVLSKSFRNFASVMWTMAAYKHACQDSHNDQESVPSFYPLNRNLVNFKAEG